MSMNIPFRPALLAMVLALPGCAAVNDMMGRDTAAAPAPASAAVPAGPQPETPEEVTEVAQAPAAAAEVTTDIGPARLGTTVVSLGNPAESGMWLKTPLVKAQAKGRVVADGGKSVEVDLIPIDGAATAGSRMSLQAMQGLGLNVTSLPTVQVFRL